MPVSRARRGGLIRSSMSSFFSCWDFLVGLEPHQRWQIPADQPAPFESAAVSAFDSGVRDGEARQLLVVAGDLRLDFRLHLRADRVALSSSTARERCALNAASDVREISAILRLAMCLLPSVLQISVGLGLISAGDCQQTATRFSSGRFRPFRPQSAVFTCKPVRCSCWPFDRLRPSRACSFVVSAKASSKSARPKISVAVSPS